MEKDLLKKVIDGLNDPEGQLARKQALDYIREKEEEIKKTLNLPKLKATMKEIEKRNLIKWKKLLGRTTQQLKNNGCRVFYAKNGKKAIKLIY